MERATCPGGLFPLAVRSDSSAVTHGISGSSDSESEPNFEYEALRHVPIALMRDLTLTGGQCGQGVAGAVCTLLQLACL
jgi:hypothetical protein